MPNFIRRVFLFALIISTLGFSLHANTPSMSTGSPTSSFDARMITLAEQLTVGAYHPQEMRIAVVGFSNLAGKETSFGDMLSEEMTTRLFQTGKYSIVERKLIAKVLKEQKLELTGPIDPDSIKNLGRLLKVEAIITGRFVNRPTDVRVFARLVDTMTGEIRSIATTTLEKDSLLLGLLGETATARSFDETPTSSSTWGNSTRFPQFTVEYKKFIFRITRAYRDPYGSAVFEIIVKNNGPTTELTFGKNGWLADDGLLRTNWGTTYAHPRIGIIGSSRPLASKVTHVFPTNSNVSIIVQFQDAGKNVYLCSSLALPVTGIENGGRQRYITFTDLPSK